MYCPPLLSEGLKPLCRSGDVDGFQVLNAAGVQGDALPGVRTQPPAVQDADPGLCRAGTGGGAAEQPASQGTPLVFPSSTATSM